MQRKIFAIAMLTAMLGASSVVAQPGQQPNPPSRGGAPGVLIAVIDIPRVFENHGRFKRNMEAIQQDVKTFEAQIVEQRKQMAKRSEKLRDLTTTSPEFKRLEEQLAREASDMSVRAQLKRKEVIEREAKEYYTAYQEITTVVEQVSKMHGISLVLRFDSKTIDATDMNAVARGVNRAIVYQSGLDITDMVLARVNGNTTARRNN